MMDTADLRVILWNIIKLVAYMKLILLSSGEYTVWWRKYMASVAYRLANAVISVSIKYWKNT